VLYDAEVTDEMFISQAIADAVLSVELMEFKGKHRYRETIEEKI
jgi:hypothetical protein